MMSMANPMEVAEIIEGIFSYCDVLYDIMLVSKLWLIHAGSVLRRFVLARPSHKFYDKIMSIVARESADIIWVNRVYWNVFLCELEKATRVQRAFYDADAELSITNYS